MAFFGNSIDNGPQDLDSKLALVGKDRKLQHTENKNFIRQATKGFFNNKVSDSGPMVRSEEVIAMDDMWESIGGNALRSQLKGLRGISPNTNFLKYSDDTSKIKFKDRSYFGANDYLPESMMKDIIETSKDLGLDPMEALSVAGLESRFSKDLVNSSETEMMRLRGGVRRESGIKSFSDWILEKGYHGDDSYVETTKDGLFLKDEWYNNQSDEKLKEYRKQYEKYSSQPVSNKPFLMSLSYLKNKGIQGYNPLEKKGNKAYGGEYTYTKDRMERYNEVRGILENEKEFMRIYNKYNNE